jgi:hypothetical protein
MKRMGPEAALLSARLAEIYSLRSDDPTDGQPIYVAAAVQARRRGELGRDLRSTRVGIWARLGERISRRPAAPGRRPTGPMSAAAIPTMVGAGRPTAVGHGATPLAFLPAVRKQDK